MALLLSEATALKPEIRLAQAVSEYESCLSADQKAKLCFYRAQSPPTEQNVIRFTAEIDQAIVRGHKTRRCVGTRLTNVLQAVQRFSSVMDMIISSSQCQIASAIWGGLKISIQVFLGVLVGHVYKAKQRTDR